MAEQDGPNVGGLCGLSDSTPIHPIWQKATDPFPVSQAGLNQIYFKTSIPANITLEHLKNARVGFKAGNSSTRVERFEVQYGHPNEATPVNDDRLL